MAHISFFGQNLQEIQYIGLNLSAEPLVENLATLLLGEGRGAEQADEVGLCFKAQKQYLHLVQDGFSQCFFQGQVIQSLSVNASDFRHTLSPNPSMNASTN